MRATLPSAQASTFARPATHELPGRRYFISGSEELPSAERHISVLPRVSDALARFIAPIRQESVRSRSGTDFQRFESNSGGGKSKPHLKVLPTTEPVAEIPVEAPAAPVITTAPADGAKPGLALGASFFELVQRMTRRNASLLRQAGRRAYAKALQQKRGRTRPGVMVDRRS
jgi:hypothetical protein